MPKTTTNILYVLNAMGGGASAGIYEIMPQLDPNKYKTYAVIPPGQPKQEQEVKDLFTDVLIEPVSWWNKANNLDWPRRIIKDFGRWRRGINVNRDIEAIKSCILNWNIDIVHTGTAMTNGGALAAKVMKIPHIWHIKETIGSKYRVQFPLNDAELARYFEALSSKIVVMSHYIGEFFDANNVKDFEIIPDGVDLDRYEISTQRELRSKLNLDRDAILIGMVASFVSDWKKHEIFVRMAGLLVERYPNVNFLMIGAKPNMNVSWPYDSAKIYYNRLVTLAKQMIPSDRIFFLDHYPDSADIMRSIDILVHPCDIEPFGRIAIEAMALGTPVVGPNQGGLSETVIHNETGLLVPPDGIELYAKAVEDLINSPELMAKLAFNGKKRVRNMYSVEIMIRRLDLLYQSVLTI